MNRTRNQLFLLSLLVFAGTISFSLFASKREIVYSWPKTLEQDPRGHYPIALLNLALEKSQTGMTTKPSDFTMTQYRTLKQLELGKGIDVVWTMTNAAREKQLRPIRIPIDRGLIGWRLLAIRTENDNLFKVLPDRNHLKSMLTVQGVDWPDYQILKANRFSVTSSNHFDGMYQMLRQNRVLFFPRSITEIWPELEQFGQQDLQVAPRWILHYPAALYFFVRKTDTDLAVAIESGLEIAIKDGSMRVLFLQHFGEAIAKAELPHRQVVELENTELPMSPPLERKELWFDPKAGY